MISAKSLKTACLQAFRENRFLVLMFGDSIIKITMPTHKDIHIPTEDSNEDFVGLDHKSGIHFDVSDNQELLIEDCCYIWGDSKSLVRADLTLDFTQVTGFHVGDPVSEK